MQYIDIIRRTFRITWTHKWLWLLGFVASLSGGGAGGFFGTGADNTGGNGFIVTTSRGSTFLGLLLATSDVWLRGSIADPEGSISLPVYIAIVLFVIGVLWLGTLMLGEIGHGGLIASVDESERGGSPRISDGWRAGVARVRRMVGLDLLLGTPAAILEVSCAVLAVLLINDTSDDVIDEQTWYPRIAALIVLSCCLVVYALITGVVHALSRRAIVLEDRGVLDGLKRGWSILRRNIRKCAALCLLTAIIGIVIGVGTAVPLSVFEMPAVIGIVMKGYSQIPMSTVAAVSVGILVLIVGVTLAVGAYVTALSSSIWTLAFRFLTANDGRPTTAAEESRESE